MRGEINIPLSFPGAPPELKRDLERNSSELDKFFRNLPKNYTPRWKYLPLATTNTFAAFDHVRRIAPAANATVIVELPRANTVDGGRELRIQRMNTNGSIYLVPPDALINGDARYHMLMPIGFVTVQWDGEGYYTDITGGAP